MRSRLLVAGIIALAIVAAVVFALHVRARERPPRMGRPAPYALIHRMDLTVTGAGDGLPQGWGTVAEGRRTFTAKCAACHGDGGTGGLADPLTGGIDTLRSAKPVRTVASYWPYAPRCSTMSAAPCR